MSDRAAVVLAVAVACAALLGPPVPASAALLFAALWGLTRRPVLLAISIVLLVGGQADRSLAALDRPLPERAEGVAELASDPERRRFSTRVVVRLDGRRYLADVPSRMAAPVRSMLTGEHVRVSGRPSPLDGAPRGWVRSQHLAGRLAVREIEPLDRTRPWHRAANGVHRLLRSGATPFGEDLPLYLGLVVGDDRGQSDLTRFRFEASGLTHLLAVSGSNVAFVLAVAAPVMLRLECRGRFAFGSALLVLFVLVTRAEPSVLRAAVMAAIALGAVTMGRVAPGRRILALAVVALLVADPLLVHSVGFRLSVAATAGLMTLARPIMERLPGPMWVTAPVSVTLAAQLATAPLLVALNGGVPSVATPANLLAAPAAGFVMVLGVTLGPVAGLVGDGTAGLVQLPAVLLVRWIDGVATVASQSPAPVLGPGRLALVLAATAAVAPAARSTSSVRRRAWSILPVLLTVAALVPAAPAPGTQHLGDGAALHVGACGGRVVVLEGVQDHRRLLRSLWAAGVRRVDVVVVGHRRSDASTAVVIAEQLDVRRLVTTAERGPPGVEPLGPGAISVGGLTVTGGGSDGGAARIGAERATCSVSP